MSTLLLFQVFLDILLRGIFGFGRVGLLILDEVHHTQKKHPYKQIMDQYQTYAGHVNNNSLPRILGEGE